MPTRLREEEVVLEIVLLLLEGALATFLLLPELLVATLPLLLDVALLMALDRLPLVRVWGFLYCVVLRVTVRLLGVWVTVLLVTVFVLGDRTVVDRFVTVLLWVGLVSRLTVFLAPIFVFERFDLVTVFRLPVLLFCTMAFRLVVDPLFRNTLLLLTTPLLTFVVRRVRFSRNATLLSFL